MTGGLVHSTKLLLNDLSGALVGKALKVLQTLSGIATHCGHGGAVESGGIHVKDSKRGFCLFACGDAVVEQGCGEVMLDCDKSI